MSAILPFHRSAVTSRRVVRSGRALPGANRAPRFSAARLAEVEARYAQLLAAIPSGVIPEYFECSEPVTAVLGTPDMDQVDMEACVVMAGDPAAPQFLLILHLGCEVVELTPAKARRAAESLHRIAAGLDAMATDAEALAAIEAGH